ncbi:AbgT family transporter [Terricaulis sp.]|uniref:AbgT family transporter n=1 Tax=Terricaulis sp. TaxID=2768686 RepID=UPI002AC46D73|nr:AbgT family transporter [Terricaulis sp.]MDZ4690884.1 AbgT family transporter [Terricaulis sp.]
MAEQATAKGFLGWIERAGNKLPDPVFIFFWLIGILAVGSAIAAGFGYSALHPTQLNEDGTPLVISAASIFSPENIQRLWVEMPQTFTHFHPLGYVLVVMLGAGVAERSGLFATAMRAAVRDAPKFLLTPVVAFVAMMGNLAADAAYVVLIPLAAVLYAAAGRHPIAGIAAAFAGVSGGFSANLLPGQLDALLFGITQAAVDASSLHPGWLANIAGNWYFIAAMLFLFLPVIWFVTDAIIEPRLKRFSPPDGEAMNNIGDANAPLTKEENKGLGRAGIAALAVVALWLFFTFGPGTPLINEEAEIEQARLTPLYQSLVAAFLILFLACGWAYGAAAGTIKGHRDVVKMMAGAMGDLAYYLVLAFAAAHFVAMFNWSNLGLIFAVQGADAIENSGLPMPALLALIVLFAAGINLLVGSASAKWALLAPVLVPMMMLLGVSPEMTTASYRVGDSVTNIITPLMVYFPLVLTFAQRWRTDFGLGSLTATMLPFSMFLMITGVGMTFAWVFLDLPLGPGAVVDYVLPTPVTAPVTP